MKSIHITFTDGSNPWFMLNASDRDIQNAIRKWKRNFIVVDRFTENDTIYMTLQVKGVDDINEQHVKSKERYLIGRNNARRKALLWHLDAAEKSLSMAEIAEANAYFEKLGRRYGLLKEFRKIGIC